jgi:predicted transcriptional regulator
MSTTSLKLPEDVKQLAAAAAKQQGVTPHAFMVDAIRTAATNAERRAQFVADAVSAREETVKSGKGYAATEVHAYLRARAQGKAAPKPRAKNWRA